jgi:GAF domain-containing protein
LGRTVSTAKTAEEACKSAARILEGNPADIPFALLYLLDSDRRRARLVATTGFVGESDATPEWIDLASSLDALAWPFPRVLDTLSAEVVPDIEKRFERLPVGSWPESPRTALVVPIVSVGQLHPTGFLVAGFSPRRIIDADYCSFFDLIAGHISTAIANACAYEQERKGAEALVEVERAARELIARVETMVKVHHLREDAKQSLQESEERYGLADKQEAQVQGRTRTSPERAHHGSESQNANC